MNTIVSTQFLLPQAVVANGAVTGSGWSNPNNVLLVDTDVAASDPNQSASDITVGNYPTNIPQNAIITGLEFEIIAKRGAQTNPVVTLTPYFLDDTSGTDVYYPYVTPITTALTPNLTTIVIGSPTYLFASAFTPNQINNAKLNFIANGDISIDSVLMKVYYYVPSTPGPTPPPSAGCDDCNSPIQAQPFYLALPFKAGDRYAYLKSFNYPDGNPIQYADLGACGGSIKLVFDPAVPKINDSNFEENAVTAVWTTEANGYVKLDFGDINVNRGLMFHTPYSADPLLRSDHDANSKVIISDSAPFLGQYIQKCQAGFVFSKPIEVDQDETLKVYPATKLNFKGSVLVQQNGINPEQADIFITAGGGTTPATVVDVVSGTSGSTPSDTITLDLAISGLNRGALFQISTEEGVTVTSILANGVAMTLAISDTDVAHNLRQEQYWILAPALGTLTIVCTLSAPASWSAGAEALVGVNQASFIGNVSSATGTSMNPSTSLTTSVDNSLVIDGLVTAMTPILYTVGPGQILNWRETANADIRQGGSSEEQAGLTPDLVTSDYSITQSTPWVITSVEILGITTAPAVGQTSIQFDDESGNPLGAPGTVDEFEITGPSVTGVRVGNKVTYTVAASGGGGSGGNIIKEGTPLGVGSTYGQVQGTIDGTNTQFITANNTYIAGTLTVWLNGQEIDLIADWIETDPTTGKWDFVIPPIVGDVIYIEYFSPSTIAQTGIQYDVNGTPIPGAVPGATDEVDIVGTGSTTVAASHIGNKTTYTINSSGGGGGGNLSGGLSYIPLGKKSTNVSINYGNQFLNNVFFDAGTSRIYAEFDNTSGSNTQSSNILRVFQNLYGTYIQETEIVITSSILSLPNTATFLGKASWTTDGNFLYALIVYGKNNGSSSSHYRRIDLIRFNLDGTSPVAVNLYAVTAQTVGDDIQWKALVNSGFQAMCFDNNGFLYVTWNTSPSNIDQVRKYDVSLFPTVTLNNTYLRSGGDNVVGCFNMSFDLNSNSFYFGGVSNSNGRDGEVTIWQISGSNFTYQVTTPLPEVAYGNNAIGQLDSKYIARVIGDVAFNSVYVVQQIEGSSGSLGAGPTSFAFWLTLYNFPKF